MMEPIQDDPVTNPIPQTTLMIPRRDFDRLVAERDRLQAGWGADLAKLVAAEAERDRLIQGIGALVEKWRKDGPDYSVVRAVDANELEALTKALTKTTEEEA